MTSVLDTIPIPFSILDTILIFPRCSVVLTSLNATSPLDSILIPPRCSVTFTSPDATPPLDSILISPRCSVTFTSFDATLIPHFSLCSFF